MSSFTVRLDDKLMGDLETLAVGMDRSKSYITAQALREYLAREAWFIADVQRGLDDVAAGRIVPEDDMEAFLDELCGAEPASPQSGD